MNPAQKHLARRRRDEIPKEFKQLLLNFIDEVDKDLDLLRQNIDAKCLPPFPNVVTIHRFSKWKHTIAQNLEKAKTLNAKYDMIIGAAESRYVFQVHRSRMCEDGNPGPGLVH